MSHWKVNLRRQSYSRTFIWKTGLFILLGGFLIGTVVDFAFDTQPRSLRERLAIGVIESGFEYVFDARNASRNLPAVLEELLQDPNLTIEPFLIAAPYLGPYYEGENESRINGLIADRFDRGLASLLSDFLGAIARPASDSRSRIEEFATRDPPVRYANRLLGELEAYSNDYQQAYPYFRSEGRFPDAERSRELAVNALLRTENYEELKRLLDEPAFQSQNSSKIQLQIAIHDRDWWTVAKLLPLEQLSNPDWRIAAIATITGLVWAILLVRLGQIESRFCRETVLCGLAFLSGALSTVPTVFLVILQDAYIGYQPDGDLIPTIAYFVGGVGFREEFCKLLFFLPFAPYLAKSRYELDALIVASFVGLGFAAEENVSYFSQSMGLAAPARFLTANFFHISLTGIGGLFLCRALRGRGFNDFFYIFAIMIIVHGAYNTLLSLPQFPEGSFFAMTVYILLSMYYFRELNDLQGRAITAFSLSFLFVSGLCLILSSLIIYQAAEIGVTAGLSAIFPEVLGSAFILFMFFREFNEALGD